MRVTDYDSTGSCYLSIISFLGTSNLIKMDHVTLIRIELIIIRSLWITSSSGQVHYIRALPTIIHVLSSVQYGKLSSNDGDRFGVYPYCFWYVFLDLVGQVQLWVPGLPSSGDCGVFSQCRESRSGPERWYQNWT